MHEDDESDGNDDGRNNSAGEDSGVMTMVLM